MDFPIINLALTEYTSIYEIMLAVSCLLSSVMAIFFCLIMLIGSLFKVRPIVLFGYMIAVLLIFTVIFFYITDQITQDLYCNDSPWDPRCKIEAKKNVTWFLGQGT